MSYIIISIYDSACNFSVCINGKVIHMYKDAFLWEHNEEIDPFLDIYYEDVDYREKYSKLDFDLVILCEDGNTEILKGEKK